MVACALETGDIRKWKRKLFKLFESMKRSLHIGVTRGEVLWDAAASLYLITEEQGYMVSYWVHFKVKPSILASRCDWVISDERFDGSSYFRSFLQTRAFVCFFPDGKAWKTFCKVPCLPGQLLLPKENCLILLTEMLLIKDDALMLGRNAEVCHYAWMFLPHTCLFQSQYTSTIYSAPYRLCP